MTYQSIVVGGGPAGLAAALALAQSGIESALITGPQRTGGDNRTAALFAGTIEFLRNLGIWTDCSLNSEPIRAIHILDDTGRFLRAPDACFDVAEIGMDAFGYNVPNADLVAALEAAAAREPRVTIVRNQSVVAVEPLAGTVRLTLADQRRFEAPVVIAADGRNSPCRVAAGVATSAWAYDQAAITCSFRHSRPHRGVSTEFHRPSGPLTTVPLPGLASSLVWVERPAIAARLTALDDGAFRGALETRLQGLLGDLSEITPRARFPLAGLTAKPMAKNRIMLVGEAGHVIPPIGAQGLNLGLRDAAAAAECVAVATEAGGDPGCSATLERYSDMRSADVAARVGAVDLMNRTLLAHYLPVHLVRGAGLAALAGIAPLRRLVMQQGMQPSTGLPRLMLPRGAAPAR